MKRVLNQTQIRDKISIVSKSFLKLKSKKCHLPVSTVMILFIPLFIFFFSGCKPNNPPDDPDNPSVVDSLGISISSVSFTADKDASLIVIRTNKDWTATENADWLSVSATTGNKNTGILIGAMKNEGFPRETTVRINAGDKTSDIKVTQAGAAKIVFTVNNVSFNMILVEGGEFTMGSSEQSTYGLPHQVKLSNFYISETETTNELWKAVKASLPYTDHSETDHPNFPLSEPSWNDIVNSFIPAMNTVTGKTFRLPTEAEWEYAAVGGKKTNVYKYAGSNTLDDVGWYSQNAANTKHNVKEKLPNELGIYDMSGNVNEWCSDWYDTYYGWPIVNQTITIPELQTNPTGPTSGTKKVIRGGSIENDEFWGFSYCNVKYRSGVNPTGYDTYEGNPVVFFMSKNTGFRLVISQ